MTDSMFPKHWARECGWGGDHGFLLSKYFWREEQRAYFVLDKPHAPSGSYLILTSALLSEYYFIPILETGKLRWAKVKSWSEGTRQQQQNHGQTWGLLAAHPSWPLPVEAG